MPSLTKRTIDAIKPQDKEGFYHDDTLSGFYVRIFPSGKKVFGVRYNLHGRSYRYKIGEYGIVTPDEARQKAVEILNEINKGNNPQAEKSLYNKAPTLKEFTKQYIEQHIKTRLKPSTQKEWVRLMDRFIIPKIGHIKLQDICRADVAYLHQSLAHIPYQGNRCKEILSSMLNHAEMWGLRAENSNPCKYIKKYKEEKRERFFEPYVPATSISLEKK